MTRRSRMLSLVAILLAAGRCACIAQSLPAPAGQAISSTPALRADVRLVIVDVSVLDKSGMPVKGLKADDFQLREDNTAEKIANVEEYGTAVHAATANVPTSDKTDLASNKSLAGSAVWNVLLVDLFNTPGEDLAAVRRQLQQFVKQLPADEPVALVTMSGQIKILTSFQDGAAAVSRYLEKNGLNPALASTPADIYGRQEEQLINPAPDMVTSKTRVDLDRQARRAQTTLDCFSAIAKWLRPYPGRKNVYWLSSGFPLQGQAFGVLAYDQMHPGPANSDGHTVPAQQSTDKDLETARVAIYPISAHGVSAPDIAGETTADTTGNLLSIGKNGDQSVDVKQDDERKAAQQSEMLAIAKATGGSAHFNNDIVKTLRADFDQGEHYYTLSYTPSNAKWNGAYRKIHLALARPGYQLIYREGYYARDLLPTPTLPAAAADNNAPVVEPIPARPTEQTRQTADADKAGGTGAQVATATAPGLVPRSPTQAAQLQKMERHITLDVVVTDSAGVPATGLQQQDLVLLDSGRPSMLASFKEVDGQTAQPPVEVVLMLDTMNPSWQDAVLVRQGMEKFLLQDGGHLRLPTSIVFLSDSGIKLDKASRDGHALAEDLKKLPQPIRMMDAAQGSSGWLERLQRSIRALNMLSTYEATRPGRKLLLWMGPGWPLLTGPAPSFNAQNQGRYFDSIVDVTTKLRDAHMTLYSVTPLNLSQGTGLRSFLYQAYLKPVENPKQADSANLAVQVLADHSGGLVLDKSGDLAGQMNRCVADGTSFYEISFDAAPGDKGNPYHALQIRVNKPGVTARTNAGYYAQP